MPAARGPDWTDLLGDLLPIVITVVVGILALTKRGVDALFKRRSQEAHGKPRPPLNEEVRQFLEEIDRDARRGIDRSETASAEEKREPRRIPEEPALAGEVRLPAESVRPARATQQSPAAVGLSLSDVAVALSVAPPIERASFRHVRVARPGSALDLRQAVIWSEILAPPLAERPPRV